jgi:hypothetical protein
VSGVVWLDGAERIPARGEVGPMSGHDVSRMVIHSSESDPGSIDGVVDWVLQEESEYHLIVDADADGRMVQMIPFTKNARSMENGGIAGGIGCNRYGRVCIQVCIVGRAKHDPLGKGRLLGMDRVVEVAESWGIPPVWPAGGRVHRPLRTWLTKSGWYGHGNAPQNSHVDPFGPGGSDVRRLFEEADVELTEKQIKQIAKAVWSERLQMPPESTSNGRPVDELGAEMYMRRILGNARDVRRMMADLEKRVAALEEGKTDVP